MAKTLLDPRLLAAGLTVSVRELVEIMADHWPYGRAIAESWSACPGCGHGLSDEVPECPTATVVRPLLWARRAEVAAVVVPEEMRAELSRPPRRGEPARRRLPRRRPVDGPSLAHAASRVAAGAGGPRPIGRHQEPAADQPSLFELEG